MYSSIAAWGVGMNFIFNGEIICLPKFLEMVQRPEEEEAALHQQRLAQYAEARGGDAWLARLLRSAAALQQHSAPAGPAAMSRVLLARAAPLREFVNAAPSGDAGLVARTCRACAALVGAAPADEDGHCIRLRIEPQLARGLLGGVAVELLRILVEQQIRSRSAAVSALLDVQPLEECLALCTLLEVAGGTRLLVQAEAELREGGRQLAAAGLRAALEDASCTLGGKIGGMAGGSDLTGKDRTSGATSAGVNSHVLLVFRYRPNPSLEYGEWRGARFLYSDDHAGSLDGITRTMLAPGAC